MELAINSKVCVNCNNVGDLISVRLEGLQSLIEYSKIHSNANLLNYFTEQGRNSMPNEVFVHQNCSRWYTSSVRKIKNKKILLIKTVKSTVLRSKRKSLNWETHYFFCEEVCVVDKKRPNRSKGWHKVGTLSFQVSLLNKWQAAFNKLSSSIDLVASDAIQHGKCESNFFTKNIYFQKRGQKPNTCLETAQVMQ